MTCEAARRRARIVAVVTGLGLLPYFWAVNATVGLPVDDAPPVGAPAAAFVDFYAENSSGLPLSVTLTIGQWVILLVFIVAIVRSACRRIDVAALTAVALAGVATSVFVMAEAMLIWPLVPSDLTANEIANTLDPGVAQAMVNSRDGIHAVAIVVLGLAMFVVAGLLARSDLWAHRFLAVTAAVSGLPAVAQIIVGSEGVGPGLVLLWGVVFAVVVLIGQRRSAARSPRPV